MDATEYPLPLSGIRVLDLSHVLSGPWASQTLGDLGAEVLKIEPPGRGDIFRNSPPHVKDRQGKTAPKETALYLSANRNKKSITLNLSSDEGRNLAKRLAAKSDVVLENFRPGAARRLGLGYEQLASENPGLIYCSISGFGQTGPDASKGGYDAIFQAMSGMMSYTGFPDGTERAGPLRAGPSFCDVNAGMYAAFSIAACLFHRTRTGRGQYIDIGMLDTTLAMISHQAMGYLAAGKDAPRCGNGSAFGAPAGLFPCKDKQVMLSCTQDAPFRRLCTVLGIPEAADDSRYSLFRDRVQNAATLDALLASKTQTWLAADLVKRLDEVEVLVAPVNSTEQAYQEPQVQHRQMLRSVDHPIVGPLSMVASPIRLSDTPISEYAPPPTLGQHTSEVLMEVLGLEAADVQKLFAKGIV